MTMSTTITNANIGTATITDVGVKWNKIGGPGNGTVTLINASLGTSFWSGSDNSGDLSIPSLSLSMVGNSQRTMQFTFDTVYEEPVGTLITIQFTVEGCGTYVVTATYLG
jgi:hypothetical protein